MQLYRRSKNPVPQGFPCKKTLRILSNHPCHALLFKHLVKTLRYDTPVKTHLTHANYQHLLVER